MELRRITLLGVVVVALQWDVVQSRISGTTNTDQDHRRENACIGETSGSLAIPDQVINALSPLAELIDFSMHQGLCDSDNPGFETFRVFRDWDDRALVASRGGYCYTVFSATVAANPWDVSQLFDWGTRDVGDCTFRGGFWKAFYSVFYDDYKAAVDECMSQNSELIVGGHSQGGSIAVVASVDLRQYNPYVITFGAPRAIKAVCNDVNPDRHYRFVNSMDKTYDDWPMRFSNSGIHVGHGILLDLNSNNVAAYVGLNDNANRSPTESSIHKAHFSYDALSKLIGTGCSPLRVAGWEQGHFCMSHEECDGSSCVNGSCVA